eukprot:8116903-Ditylum_brightwellii.AAC.1
MSSIDWMASMHHWLINGESQELDDAYKYDKAISIFSKSSGGFHHTGGLLSQHLFVIGAAVGIYPLDL